MTKTIQDFPNYSISDTGEILNLTTNKVKTHTLGKNGYYVVHLYKNNKCKREYVHRLLAKHYIPNPDNKRTVNHINGDKTDNTLNNLEWNTDAENIKHAYTTNLKRGSRKLQDDRYTELLETFLSGTSLTTLAKVEKVALATMSKNLKRTARLRGVYEIYCKQLTSQKEQRAALAGLNKRNTITLLMVDITTGETLNTFTSITDAKLYLNKSSSGPISNTIAGRQKSGYGYFWKKV